MREQNRNLRRAQRDIEKDRRDLERQEKQLVCFKGFIMYYLFSVLILLAQMFQVQEDWHHFYLFLGGGGGQWIFLWENPFSCTC